MINGILNVYKEAGFTSHDVVGKAARHMQAEKIWPYRYPGSGSGRGTSCLPGQRHEAVRICLLIKARNMRPCFFWDR